MSGVTMKVLQPLWNQSSPRMNNMAYSNYSYPGIGPKECVLKYTEDSHLGFPEIVRFSVNHREAIVAKFLLSPSRWYDLHVGWKVRVILKPGRSVIVSPVSYLHIFSQEYRSLVNVICKQSLYHQWFQWFILIFKKTKHSPVYSGRLEYIWIN